ncbi:MFS transporter [Mesorhizobium sp. M1A.F.Ca.IN.020.30.1.1]|uniref:MFS transporter n=6 Tax=Mesorhizobium TaxID=68287 RepID=UPI000F74EF83|nr:MULTISPECIES: MFS transporter [unclassified Mesorhizobium]AZO61456.1 MFS transporter [Mesorhizobium sp. M1A.F.Ca.IN.022.06.1.1]MCT2577219.1 MFS transporter [Mesorhizobium sp. P13.3]MDF3166157.1 MFS transporter [Mesorhizobium sp. P16.1]MDF3175643.1 MFS transporter [Mesorhizobium sp. P17.1]MDF3183070.1 MFS transporter [Mesorhizobium sp. ICCV3110.1]
MSAVSGSPLGMAADSGRWRVLLLLCLAVVLSLTTWFSATAILPELRQELALGAGGEAWLTNGVQVGFVIGALGASLVNLPDLVRLSRLMAAAAFVAALANASLLFHLGPGGVIAARIVTGAALAGVYPPALKLVATWFTRDRGLALGAVIGALTIGSALPHLFRAVLTALDWRPVVAAASLAMTVGALLFLLFAREGPYPFGKAVFEPSRIGQVFRERPLLLANLGYLGHMWELYAMWAWLLAYTRSAFEAQAIGSAAAASLSTFFVVASGIIGCLLGGYLSDRIGRTATTAGMMIVSGSCALLMGFLFAGPLWLFMLVAVVWGISVIGDSAQFSAAVTELGDRRFVGTALSVQLGAGFALTVLAIWLTPRFADFIGGWRWAFLLLVPGPLLGAAAMLWLRNLPESEKMAGGLR